MNNKKGGHNIDEEATASKEIKLLYEMGEGKTFSFDHGHPDRPNDYHGHEAFKSFFQELILLLLYTKSFSPKKNLTNLLEIHSHDYAIARIKHLVNEKRGRFQDNMRGKRGAKSLEKTLKHAREMKQLHERLKQLLDMQSSQKEEFYKFLELEINDKSMISDTGLYDCWVYLTEALKTKTQHRDPRAIIVKLINLLHKKKDSLFNTNFKKFFDIITSEHGKEPKPLSSFLTGFCEKNNVKKMYSTQPKVLFEIPNTQYTASLYYNHKEQIEVPDRVFESSGRFNKFLIRSRAHGKRNYGGTISLNEVMEKLKRRNHNLYIEPDQPRSKKIKTKPEADGLSSFDKNNPQQFFYDGEFDLAVLEESALTDRYSRRADRTTTRHGNNKKWELFEEATSGVKKNGHIVLLVDKQNLGRWSMYLYYKTNKTKFRFSEDRLHGENSLSLKSVINYKNNVWIIFKKSQKEEGAVGFLEASKLDYKSIIKELYKKDSKYVAKIRKNDLIKSRYNLNSKRWFMPNFKGLPLSSFLSYYRGEKPTKVRKIKLVNLFSNINKSSGGLDYQKIEPQLVPPDFHKTTNVEKIKKSCLLLSPLIKGLNPIWFEYKYKKPIYIDPTKTVALQINSKIEEGLFLELKLKEKTTQKQLTYLETNTTRLGYNYREIMDCLKIQIPSVEKQKEFIETKKREKIKELEKQIDQIEERSGVELKKDFDFLEHAIKSPVFKITSSTKLLKSFVSNLDKRFSEELKKTFQERYDEKIEDFLGGLISAATEIPKIVNTAKTRAQFSLKQYPNKEYSYKEVVAHIERTVNKIKNKNYNISVENNLDQKARDLMYTAWSGFMRKQLFSDKVMDQELEKYLEMLPGEEFNPVEDYVNDKTPEVTAHAILNINLDLLDILIQNLLDNAEKHGELEKTKNGEVVIGFEEDHIGLSKDSDGLRIAISVKNNGKPMKKNITKKAFWQKGFTTNKKTGSGYGGAIIKNVCENFNWDFELINDETKNHPVSFVFKALPNIKLTKKQ